MKVINMKILYIDMDGVLVNFQTGIDKLTEHQDKNSSAERTSALASLG